MSTQMILPAAASHTGPSASRYDSTEHGTASYRFMGISGVKGWSRRWDSNPRPSVYETDALPLSYFGQREGRF